jgi:hypothetical protein
MGADDAEREGAVQARGFEKNPGATRAGRTVHSHRRLNDGSSCTCTSPTTARGGAGDDVVNAMLLARSRRRLNQFLHADFRHRLVEAEARGSPTSGPRAD